MEEELYSLSANYVSETGVYYRSKNIELLLNDLSFFLCNAPLSNFSKWGVQIYLLFVSCKIVLIYSIFSLLLFYSLLVEFNTNVWWFLSKNHSTFEKIAFIAMLSCFLILIKRTICISCKVLSSPFWNIFFSFLFRHA